LIDALVARNGRVPEINALDPQRALTDYGDRLLSNARGLELG